jgi:hypothetical protein
MGCDAIHIVDVQLWVAQLSGTWRCTGLHCACGQTIACDNTQPILFSQIISDVIHNVEVQQWVAQLSASQAGTTHVGRPWPVTAVLGRSGQVATVKK